MHGIELQGPRRLGVQGARQGRIAGAQLGQQFGGDGQQVTAGQCHDLARVAKTRAHDLGGDAEVLVVLVDGAHGTHAGVVGAGHGGLVPLGAGLLLVPVVDAAHEGRDQLHLGLSAGHGLAEREQQREVGVNAAQLQLARRLDAFPGGGDLDEHAVDVHAFGLVQLDQALGTCHGGRGIEGQARIDFSGDTARNGVQDLAAEAHQHAVHDLVEAAALVLGHGGTHQRCVLGLLHRLEDERGIGGRIPRLELGQLVEVAGIGHHGRVLSKRIKLVHGTSFGREPGEGRHRTRAVRLYRQILRVYARAWFALASGK